MRAVVGSSIARGDCKTILNFQRTAMNPTLILIGAYLVVTIVLQLIGFVISRAVDQIAPSVSLLVFLTLFLGSFGLGWPIAVRITQPKTAEGRLKNDLLVLRSTGMIGEFSVENRKDVLFVQISAATNSPSNLRHVVAEALGGAIAESRIVLLPQAS
jgi:hypothetical protein